jgi:hypothetical protein
MGTTNDEGIYRAWNDWDLELGCAIIPDLSLRDWCVLFGVLPNRIEDLPFAIVKQGGMLPAVSGLVQPMCEG